MDKLIEKVNRDEKAAKKGKFEKDMKVLKKADKVQDKKLEKCDKEMHKKGKK